MYYKTFEIRWSDVDANRHLANSAYINFMSHTRMAFLIEAGIDQHYFAKYNIGPVVFHEHIYYFKEVFPGKPIRVSLELKGLSEDGMFFEFHHNFYNTHGKNLAHCEMMGGWIDMGSRKLSGLQPYLLDKLKDLAEAENVRLLSKEDTRKFGKKPIDIE